MKKRMFYKKDYVKELLKIIRTETDTCVVAVLDRRAAEGQRYHAAVLEALPKCRLSDSLEDVARFIRERKTLEYFQQ